MAPPGVRTRTYLIQNPTIDPLHSVAPPGGGDRTYRGGDLVCDVALHAVELGLLLGGCDDTCESVNGFPEGSVRGLLNRGMER